MTSTALQVPRRSDGGSRIIPRNIDRSLTMLNHDGPESLAARRAEGEALVRLLMADVARNLLVNVPPSERTHQQTQLLQDIVRGRRNMAVLAELMALASKSATPFFLSESVHGAIERALPPSAGCAVDALLDETRSQAEADVAQVQFIVERSPTRRDACIQLCVQQMAKLRVWLNVLHKFPSRGAA